MGVVTYGVQIGVNCRGEVTNSDSQMGTNGELKGGLEVEGIAAGFAWVLERLDDDVHVVDWRMSHNDQDVSRRAVQAHWNLGMASGGFWC